MLNECRSVHARETQRNARIEREREKKTNHRMIIMMIIYLSAEQKNEIEKVRCDLIDVLQGQIDRSL